MNKVFGRIGFEIGPESRIGMPVCDVFRIKSLIGAELVDCTLLMAEIRHLKSAAEIARIRHICSIAGDAFAALPAFVKVGDSEKEICRRFAASLLLNGADKAPYTSIGSGQGGYDSIIMGPTERRVEDGDVLILDTGAKYGGYFCDFDRNFSFGKPTAEVERLYEVLWLATEAAIEAAKPGRTAADVFHAQVNIMRAHGIDVGNVGRLGHGLGKVLTEPPSIAPGDATILRPGMVITIEPSAMFGDGRIMAHEEDLLITEGSAELLTPRASREIVVIS